MIELLIQKADTLLKRSSSSKDSSYQIDNRTDLGNAIQHYLNSNRRPAFAKRHIIQRARQLKAIDALPSGWNIEKADKPLPEGLVAALVTALNLLRSTALIHQVSHWTAEGDYADHLLYERLYEATGEDIDTLAEKIIGLGESSFVAIKPEGVKEMADCLNHCGAKGTEISASTSAEDRAKTALESAYNIGKAMNGLTLGLDDLLMSLCSNRETALYLLKQRSNGVLRKEDLVK